MREPKEIIATPRLLLRSPAPADLQSLHDHVLSDAAVMRFAFFGRPMSTLESRAFFDRYFDHEGSGRKLCVLAERATVEVIGFAGLLPSDALGEADYELGFVLRRSAWGKGYATEIGRGQLAYGFGELGLRRLLAQAAPDNAASIAALKKIGMEFVCTVENDQRGERRVYLANRWTRL